MMKVEFAAVANSKNAEVIDDTLIVNAESQQELENVIHQLLCNCAEVQGGHVMLSIHAMLIVDEHGVKLKQDGTTPAQYAGDALAVIRLNSLPIARAVSRILSDGAHRERIQIPPAILKRYACEAARSITQTINAMQN
jgi:hypothetical protein